MPIYEYQCGACGPFSAARPMAASALPSPCPRCAVQAPRVLSATAIASGGRRRRGAAREPTVVTADRREPPKSKPADPLRAPRRPRGADRPWMVGH